MSAIRTLAILIVGVWLLWLTGCMEKMFYVPTRGQTPPPAGMPGTEMVRFTSADGTRLAGWFIPARQRSGHDDGDGADGRDLPPTILHVHGNAGNVTTHIDFTSHLPPAGFNLFIFDFRGYGESGGWAWRRGPLIEDTEAALEYLFTRDDVDPDRIGMYGQSLGGSIGLNVMADRPEIRCAVLESPFTSWRTIAANVIGGDPPGPIARTLAALFIPDTHRADHAIQTIDRPILIFHGDADRIVPVSHSVRLNHVGGDNVELAIMPGGDHNTLSWTHPKVNRGMIEFFRRHLDAHE